jgi:uncharacterized protein with NRDE domain
MCLIVFSYRQRQDYPLIVAANRDEFYNRPTAPLDFWPDRPDILAGRDLKNGGTWMGVHRKGRWAAITNYRDPAFQRNGAPSRGMLVRDFIAGSTPAAGYLEDLTAAGDRYNGFNLLLGDATGLWYYSNRGQSPVKLLPGFYGLSNHLLDTNWPKIRKSREALQGLVENDRRFEVEAVFEVLSDQTPAPDHQLPDTGIGLEWERTLSPVFITSETYGTRSSSVLLVTASGALTFWERTYRFAPAAGRTSDTRRHRIHLPPDHLP